MKAIVTGGAGFIGSHVADELIAKGFDVVVIDNLSSTKGSLRNIENRKIRFIKEDITNKEKINEIFRKERADYVFHLAAQASVAVSVKKPELDYLINVKGSKNIIDASIKNGVKKLIYSGSGGSAYGDFYLNNGIEKEMEKLAPDENQPFKPISPYAKNKVEVIRILQKQNKLRWTALMYTNVYGPRQDPFGEAGVIAIFCQKMLNGEQPTIFGQGKCVRDYVYVSDAAKTNILAINKGDNEIINIGTNKGADVNTIFELIKKGTMFDKEPIQAPFREGDVLISIVNINKAKKVLNWKPNVRLDEGIKKTIKYFAK